MQWKVIFHGYFAVRLDSPPTGDEPALLLEGFLHVSNIPTNKVFRLTDFATGPRPKGNYNIEERKPFSKCACHVFPKVTWVVPHKLDFSISLRGKLLQ